jgi:hypothetical protein
VRSNSGANHVGARLVRRSCALFWAVGLAAGLTAGMSGCATVAPYERERLARRDMQLERNGDSSAGEEHATAYREGSSGGGSSSGGGCGCN